MRKALCIESCRIEHPADLKGDYIRGQTYDALRLTVYEPHFFKLMVSEEMSPPAESLATEEAGSAEGSDTP